MKFNIENGWRNTLNCKLRMSSTNEWKKRGLLNKLKFHY